MNAYSNQYAIISWLLWTSILLPQFLIYFLNRTHKVTRHVIWSFLLTIPVIIPMAMFAYNSSLHSALMNPVPALSAFFIYYWGYGIENTGGTKQPEMYSFLFLMFSFSFAMTLIVSGPFMDLLLGKQQPTQE